jgi:aromatic-L-amino-acid/L-tryptophan decarboxylase
MKNDSRRTSALEMEPADFRRLGHEMVERISALLERLQNGSIPVTPSESPSRIREILGQVSLPPAGRSPQSILDETVSLLFDHSLYNGHPGFWGYVTSSAAPIGMLGDLLASAVNPNVGAFPLSPVATEMELQTVRWIAELIGYPVNCGGILVSGGNMANFVGFLAGRKAKIPWDARTKGVGGSSGKQPRIYCSSETHTWVNKAADLFGFGTDSIRWVETDSHQRMNTAALRRQIESDLKGGDIPLLVVGTAGTVSTGAIDPLAEIGTVCKENALWFHVDGAYGGFAAALPEASADLKALSLADSVAVDPHKWLYSPLEAGCALVRDQKLLLDAFSYHPVYYKFDDHAKEEVTNFYELGLQNSRGFRALKVWLGLRQAGRDGYVRMIRDDCRLAEQLFLALRKYPDLEPLTYGLSITTFRYVPPDLRSGDHDEYLNKLNEELLARIQASGKAYPSNAVVGGKYALRVCIVNFRTTLNDLMALPPLVVDLGKEVDAELRRRA